jgi:cbb3-type cytochrome oxidase subunit 1
VTQQEVNELRRRLEARRRSKVLRHPLSLPVVYGLVGMGIGVTLALLVIGFVHGGLQ